MSGMQQMLAALGPAAAVTFDAAVLADSPAGYWKLDETAGATAVDSSGNGRDGSYVNSPTLSSTGVTLNGSSQYVRVSSSAFDVLGNANQDCTVAITIKTATSQNLKAYLDKTQISSPSARWLLLQAVSNQVHFQFYDGTNNPTLQQPSGALNDDVDHYLVVVRDAANSQIKLYLDGAQVGVTVSDAGSRDYDNTVDLCFGCRQDGTDRFFAGRLRRAAVFFSALSAARIAAHYAARNL